MPSAPPTLTSTLRCQTQCTAPTPRLQLGDKPASATGDMAGKRPEDTTRAKLKTTTIAVFTDMIIATWL